MELFKNNEKLIYKLIFIYNALAEGWQIKMIKKDKFIFTKLKNEILCIDNYLSNTKLEKEFIKRNSNLKNFIKNINKK